MNYFSQYLPYYKRNLQIAIPVMLTQMGAALVGVFDSMMVGHYSTVDLAAVSFSNAIFFTAMVFAMGAIMGLTPLIGPVFVQGKSLQVTSYLQNGIVFTILLSVLMTILLALVIPVLDYFGQEQVVIEASKPYYIMLVISILPFLFFFLFKQFLEGLGNTLWAMIITMATNLLNIGLNWVLIFGHLGFHPMGATGAGIATLVSRLLMPIAFVLLIRFKKEWRQYFLLMSKRLFRIKEIVTIAKVGIPIGGQSVLEAFIFTTSFILVGWINKESLAAHQIANQIADLTFMLATGIGAATTIRISHQLGMKNVVGVKMASTASIHLCLLMNTIGMLLMVGFRHMIPLAFTKDPAVITIAEQLILFAAAFQYADGMQTVGAAMLRGLTDVRISTLIAFISYICVALPIGYVCMFSLHMGASGIWVGFVVGLFLAAILFHTRFHRKMQQMK